MKDMQVWLKSLKQGASKPKEATTLEKLTTFLQFMQVKYGSRWISIPAVVPHMKVLITDPVKTAKQLYGKVYLFS